MVTSKIRRNRKEGARELRESYVQFLPRLKSRIPLAYVMKISKDEVQKIMNLPRRDIKVGGDTKSGYFDAEANALFICNADGNLTGQMVTLKAPTPKPQTEKSATNDNALEDKGQQAKNKKSFWGQKNNCDQQSDQQADHAESGQAMQRLKGLMVGTLVCSILACGLSGISLMQNNSGNYGQAGIETDVPDETVYAIGLKSPILAGQRITAEDLEMKEVSSSVVADFAMFGRDICLWEQAETLIDSYAVRYMDTDHYIERDDVTSTPPQTTSPWAMNTNYRWEVELNSEDPQSEGISFGSILSANIRVTYNNQVAGNQGNGESTVISGDGVIHTTTVSEMSRIEEYTLQDLTVIDVLNSNKESLYATYKAFSKIPVSERVKYITQAMLDDETLQNRLTPCYVVVDLAQAQTAVVDQISSANASEIMLRNTNAYEQETERKRDESLSLSVIFSEIQEAIAQMQKIETK